MAGPTIKWFLAMGLCALLHFAAIVGLILYSVTYHYDRAITPVDPLFYAVTPLCLLCQPDAPFAFIVLISNCVIMGAAGGTVVAWWFGWLAALRFSLRTMLIVTTLLAVVFGLVVWAAR